MVKLNLKEIEPAQVTNSSFQNFCRKVCEDVATKKSKSCYKDNRVLKREKPTAKIKSELKEVVQKAIFKLSIYIGNWIFHLLHARTIAYFRKFRRK